jgi:hypothetical protein
MRLAWRITAISRADFTSTPRRLFWIRGPLWVTVPSGARPGSRSALDEEQELDFNHDPLESPGALVGRLTRLLRVGSLTTAAALLQAVTQHRKVIGALGQAAAAKLSTNLVLGLNRLALAEGMALAESLGIERARYLDLLLDSAATSRAAQEKGPMMVADHFEPPVATVAQHAKDVGLMLELGRQSGQKLPMSELRLAAATTPR